MNTTKQQDLDVFQSTFMQMILETRQASNSLGTMAECAEALLENREISTLEGPMFDIMWIFEQISNHQRYMLERMELKLTQVTAVKAEEPSQNQDTPEHYLATSGL